VSRVEITAASGKRALSEFVAFPYSFYRRDPLWAAPLRPDARRLHSRDNPFFEHAEAGYFLARYEGTLVGRIAAIHNRLHNEFHADRVGFFGFFQSVDDPEVAGALFDAAGAWLRTRGLDVMRGPASYSTNDEVGLLVDGFDTPPTLMMPYNPRYYPGLVEGAGFRKVKDLLAYQTTGGDLPPRLVEGTDLLRKRHRITTRSLRLRHFRDEIALIKRLYNAGWERNWGFVPMTDREIDHLAGQLKPIVVPQIVPFAERNGEVIGFAAAIPDFNMALRTNPSGRFFPGIIRVTWSARKIARIRVLLLGTLPEWRGKGIDALLYRHIWEEGARQGYTSAEAGWVLEDNHAMRNALVRMGFEVSKTYRLYDRPL